MIPALSIGINAKYWEISIAIFWGVLYAFGWHVLPAIFGRGFGLGFIPINLFHLFVAFCVILFYSLIIRNTADTSKGSKQ